MIILFLNKLQSVIAIVKEYIGNLENETLYYFDYNVHRIFCLYLKFLQNG